MPSPLAGAHLFISDLHLQAEEPGIHALFECFLTRYASEAASLTINGDFLNAYAGFRQLSLPYWRELAARMKQLAERGLPIRFVSGNRDFMLVRDARRMGMAGYWEYTLMQSERERIGVIHGDVFCLADKSYLKFRTVIRALPLHWINIITPPAFGQWVTRTLRKKSMQKHESTVERVLPSYWDIHDAAVLPFMREHDLDVLLCGHIHQPQERIYRDGARERRLLIKGDWSAHSAIIAAALPGEPVALFELREAGVAPWQHEIKHVDASAVSDAPLRKALRASKRTSENGR